MGIPEVNTAEFSPGGREAGFSLVEVLVSTVIVGIVVTAVLQGLGGCLQISRTADDLWRDSLGKWNRVQILRSQRGNFGEDLVVLPEARPMSRLVVEPGPGRHTCSWEVVGGGK